MSTNCTVIVKVRKEDIGKVMKFDETSLPIKLDDWKLKDYDGNVWKDETGENICESVEINKKYIGIYCHWDGYFEGVGACLKKHFKDYNSALNLVVGGSCSSIIRDEVRHYANRQEEMWKYIKPKQSNTQKDIIYPFAEYVYVFDENKGGWSARKHHPLML